jgi:hypothetical protein
VKNPKQISWKDPVAYEDGSAFTATDFRAYELGHSKSTTPPANALLALPVAFGVGTSPIPDQVKQTLGTSFLFLRTVDYTGQTSVWTAPVEVRFTGRPLAPDSVTVS